jgi:hypothetical protein
MTWSNGHKICRHFPTSPPRCLAPSSMCPEIDVEKNTPVCRDSPYVSYFKDILQSPPSVFHKDIATIILGLYDTLENSIDTSSKAWITKAISFRSYFPNLSQLMDRDKSLNRSLSFRISPISFSIPNELIVPRVPSKSKSFGRAIPGNYSTYFNVERDYFDDIQRSLFAWTVKKEGWDCVRHYEIMALGSIPLFCDIDFIFEDNNIFPPMVMHPTSLYSVLRQYPGLRCMYSYQSFASGERLGWAMECQDFNMSANLFDRHLYKFVVTAILQYTKNVFSTVSMASYMLQTYFHKSLRSQSSIRSILYLSHDVNDNGDYMVDLTLHGLIEYFGEDSTVIVDYPQRKAVRKTIDDFLDEDYHRKLDSMYGRGFTFALRTDPLSKPTPQETTDTIANKIEAQEFDLVIYAAGHRHNKDDNKSEEPVKMWRLICSHYSRDKVIVLDGGDHPIPIDILDDMVPCSSHLFTREGVGRPYFMREEDSISFLVS